MTTSFLYSAIEGVDPAVPVRIESSQGILIANEITLTVSPLTIAQAIMQGLLEDEDTDDNLSPRRASKKDI